MKSSMGFNNIVVIRSLTSSSDVMRAEDKPERTKDGCEGRWRNTEEWADTALLRNYTIDGGLVTQWSTLQRLNGPELYVGVKLNTENIKLSKKQVAECKNIIYVKRTNMESNATFL